MSSDEGGMERGERGHSWMAWTSYRRGQGGSRFADGRISGKWTSTRLARYTPTHQTSGSGKALVCLLDFKSRLGGQKLPGWVRFPCAPASLPSRRTALRGAGAEAGSRAT